MMRCVRWVCVERVFLCCAWMCVCVRKCVSAVLDKSKGRIFCVQGVVIEIWYSQPLDNPQPVVAYHLEFLLLPSRIAAHSHENRTHTHTHI